MYALVGFAALAVIVLGIVALLVQQSRAAGRSKERARQNEENTDAAIEAGETYRDVSRNFDDIVDERLREAEDE